ncbi:MAG: hydrolase [Candidatus Xenobia bacterium]|jgi:ATP adenylyltransferase
MADYERLWAPWRMGWIAAPKDPGCFLCRMTAEDDDARNYLLERGQHCFVCLNGYPYNNGHLLISPYRHNGELGAATPEELTEMMLMAQRWAEHLKKAINPSGYNLGMNVGVAGGAGVAEHLHLHLLPRWGGDHNFMSVVADTRVINQSLEACYQALREAASS